MKVCKRLFSETFHDVLVVLHHFCRDGAVEGAGHLHGIVNRVLDEGPRGKGGAGHQNCSVEQAFGMRKSGWSRPVIIFLGLVDDDDENMPILRLPDQKGGLYSN